MARSRIAGVFSGTLGRRNLAGIRATRCPMPVDVWIALVGRFGLGAIPTCCDPP